MKQVRQAIEIIRRRFKPRVTPRHRANSQVQAFKLKSGLLKLLSSRAKLGDDHAKEVVVQSSFKLSPRSLSLYHPQNPFPRFKFTWRLPQFKNLQSLALQGLRERAWTDRNSDVVEVLLASPGRMVSRCWRL